MFRCRLSLPKAEVVNYNLYSSTSVARWHLKLVNYIFDYGRKLEVAFFFFWQFFLNCWQASNLSHGKLSSISVTVRFGVKSSDFAFWIDAFHKLFCVSWLFLCLKIADKPIVFPLWLLTPYIVTSSPDLPLLTLFICFTLHLRYSGIN